MNQASSDENGRYHEFREGWPILLGSVLAAMICVSALPFYTQGQFILELEAEFGWTRSDLAFGFLMKTICLAVSAPFVGKLVDMYGVRIPAGLSFLGLALVFILLGTVMESYSQFLLLYGLLALLGSGTSPVSFTRVVNGWFQRSRGLALGITLTGIGITATFVPRLLAEIIERYDWRAGYVSLGLMILGLAPLALYLLKPNANHKRINRQITSDGMSLFEARKKLEFWKLLLTFFLLALAINGILVHFIPLLISFGFSKADAASVAGLMGVSIALSRLGVGYLVDYFFAPRVGALVFALCAIGLVLLSTLGESAAPLAAIVIGVGMGAEVDLIGYLTVRYFGLRSYGQIYGLLYATFICGSGLGPIWIAYSYDITGAYGFSLVACIAILVLVVLILATLPAFRNELN